MLSAMRPEILFPLFAPITTLKGVGARVAPLLEKVAGPIVRDVLFLPPSGFVRRPVTTVDQAREGEVQTLFVAVAQHLKPARRELPWKIRCFDDTGFISLIWFKGHGDHLLRNNPPNARRVVSGKVERFHDERQMVHPDYVLDAERAADIPQIETVYPATAGLPSRTIRRFALEALDRAPELPDWNDPAWLARE
jgi:ATP-dependent DNA helicase RecG